MSPSQCRAARALLDWTQPQLAAASGLGLSTVVDFEKSRRAVAPESVAALQRALEAAGIVFMDDVHLGVGMRAVGAESYLDANDNLEPARSTGGIGPIRPKD